MNPSAKTTHTGGLGRIVPRVIRRMAGHVAGRVVGRVSTVEFPSPFLPSPRRSRTLLPANLLLVRPSLVVAGAPPKPPTPLALLAFAFAFAQVAPGGGGKTSSATHSGPPAQRHPADAARVPQRRSARLAPRPPARVTPARLEWLTERLTGRDHAILATLAQLRMATGDQLERLHFTAHPAGHARATARRRALARLVSWGALSALPRRIGGPRRGSARTVYTLAPAGQRLTETTAGGRRAPSDTPGARFTAHVLDVTELYVQLAEHARTGGFKLTRFDAEPASWWTIPGGPTLKPDAYTALTLPGSHIDTWWIEVDRATETIPTITAKTRTYLDFANSGLPGPDNTLPRVLITTPTPQRTHAITRALQRTPNASALVLVTPHEQAATALVAELSNQ